MADNLGLEEFEDPAPSKSTVDAASTIVPTAPQNALSRRLRFRAEVDVSDRRYRGRRVTREDVELDGRSLGLLNEERISSDYEEASSLHELDENIDDENGTGSDDSTPNESLEGEDEGSLSDDGIGNAHIDPLHKKSPVPNPGQKRFDDEEHALAGRLTAAKQSDLRRAAAVQNQKAVYDAIVNLRIRLEPLMTLARSFPSQPQRNNVEAWSCTEEVMDAMQSAQNALRLLVSQSEAAWTASWPSDDDSTDVSFEKWRDAVLNHWGRKVDDASGLVPKAGFKVFDTSVSGQVKATLASGKHLDRTRRVRNPLPLLGEIQLKAGLHDMHFDDGEFYRALLREIIETGDAPGGGLRYAQLSKQGGIKKKRNVAYVKSKRLRYDVHEKMVGFLPPVPLPDPGPVDEIVLNLFGGNGRAKKTNS